MRYRGNPYVIDKCNGKKSHFILLVILGIIFLVLSLILLSIGMIEEMCVSMSRSWDIDSGFIWMCFWLFFISICASTVANSVGIAKLNQLIEKVYKSYICIESAKITGYGYTNEIGSFFSVELRNVSRALYSGQEDGYNLTLITHTQTYNCLAIDKAMEAAEVINELVQNQSQIEKLPPEEKNLQTARNTNDKKCIFCGKYLPKTQVYCGACGRRQD